MNAGRFLIGVMPDGGIRMALRFGGQAVLIDFDRRVAVRVGRDLQILGEVLPEGGLPSGWAEHAQVNRLVDGCVEAFGQILEHRTEPFGEVGVNVRLTVLGVTADVEISGRPALKAFEQFCLEEADADERTGGWAPLDRWLHIAGDETFGNAQADGHDSPGRSSSDGELVTEHCSVKVGGQLHVGQPAPAPMDGRVSEGGGDEPRAAGAADLGPDRLEGFEPKPSVGCDFHDSPASRRLASESSTAGRAS